MAKFKSIQTGEVYEFHLEQDIVTMRKHNEYVEVTEEVKEQETSEVKKLGRPAKLKE